MEITNTRYYGLEESVLASGYPMLAKAPTEQEFKDAIVDMLTEQGRIKYVEKDDIEQRIKTGLNLIYNNQLHFYEACSNVINDFRNAEYDTKKIEKTGVFSRNKEYTSLGHLDSVDAVEYAFTHYKKYFKR